jgi:TRAP-type mannitol/chloroaromatic compound transport system permease small subunit
MLLVGSLILLKIFHELLYKVLAVQNDTHVRVDVFYLNFPPKTQALINIIGSVVFILPISLLITY